MRVKIAGWILLLLSLILSDVQGQETFRTRSSPLALAQARFRDGYMKITYSQPQKRGRNIFGALVPYGEVWRTGANEATEITITRDMMVRDQVLKAGTYSLFTIPGPDQWTIILSRDVGLWGSYNYTPLLDVMRLEVPVEHTSYVTEALTITINERNELADVLIQWDTVSVTIPFKFLTTTP